MNQDREIIRENITMTEQEYRDCCPDCGGVGMFIGGMANPKAEFEVYRCITENCGRDTFTA